MGLFLLFYLAWVTFKVASITIQISDIIHRIHKSGKSSWHQKWRERTLSNPFLPTPKWSSIERVFLYGFFTSLSHRKCNPRLVWFVLCKPLKYALRFWSRDQTQKNNCLAVNLKKNDHHILKQSICQALP